MAAKNPHTGQKARAGVPFVDPRRRVVPVSDGVGICQAFPQVMALWTCGHQGHAALSLARSSRCRFLRRTHAEQRNAFSPVRLS